MIQRIQSIFLLIVAVTMLSMLFMQTWSIRVEDEQKTFIISPLYAMEKIDGQDLQTVTFPYTAVGILVLLSGIVAIVEIFKYNNRLTQIKLGALNALLISATLVVSMFLIYNTQKSYLPNYGGYGIGIYFPVIGLVFNLLANRFIRRDEKLVRSVDRLR